MKREPARACILRFRPFPTTIAPLTSQKRTDADETQLRQTMETSKENRLKSKQRLMFGQKGQFLSDWQGLASNPLAVAAVVMIALQNSLVYHCIGWS